MKSVLFQIDERDPASGNFSGAHLQVYRTREYGDTRICAVANRAGLDAHSAKLTEFRVEELSISNQDLLAVSDSLPNRDRIRALRISQDLFLPEDPEIAHLSQFPMLRSLTFLPVAPKRPISEVAPGLEFLQMEDSNSSCLKGLRSLIGLNIGAGAATLDTCPSDNLQRLFLGAFSPGQEAKLSHFQSLKTLAISSRKRALDFGFLNDFPNLEAFAFDGPAEQNWMTLPQGLRLVSIERSTDAAAIGAHLSSAEVVSIGFNPGDPFDDGYYRGDLLEMGDPFRTIEGPVRSADIL